MSGADDQDNTENGIDNVGEITVTCDQKKIGSPLKCDKEARKKCTHMPMEWGKYCCYELKLIDYRREDLLKVYERMTANRLKSKSDTYHLNHNVLWQICFYYVNDLKRERLFHQLIGGCDESRRGAFFARLISQFRPIETLCDVMPNASNPHQNWYLRLNELFALLVFQHYLGVTRLMYNGNKDIKKIVDDLLFLFAHRDPQPESLVCIGRLLRALEAKSKQSSS